MAEFTLTIADEDTERVTAALSAAGGASEPSEANAKACVMAFIQATVANVEASAARQTALDAVVEPGPVSLS